MTQRRLFLVLNLVGIVAVPVVCLALRIALGLTGWMFVMLMGLSISLIPVVFAVQAAWSLLIPERAPHRDRLLLSLWGGEVLSLWLACAIMMDFGDTGPGVSSPLLRGLPPHLAGWIEVEGGFALLILSAASGLLWGIRVIWMHYKLGRLPNVGE